jgi:hypothetical protein
VPETLKNVVHRVGKGVRVECILGSELHDGLSHFGREGLARAGGRHGHARKGELCGQVVEVKLADEGSALQVVLDYCLGNLIESDHAGAAMGSEEDRVPHAGTEGTSHTSLPGLVGVVPSALQQAQDGAH